MDFDARLNEWSFLERLAADAESEARRLALRRSPDAAAAAARARTRRQEADAFLQTTLDLMKDMPPLRTSGH